MLKLYLALRRVLCLFGIHGRMLYMAVEYDWDYLPVPALRKKCAFCEDGMSHVKYPYIIKDPYPVGIEEVLPGTVITRGEGTE